jgi:hypothetical protein
MMKTERQDMIKVYHISPKEDFSGVDRTLVAEVATTDLEYAYRWTNNVEGSWSIKTLDIQNGDYNPAVTVIAPLYVDKNGKAWGHRSTSVNDEFELNGKIYRVAPCGFEEKKAA